MTPCAVATASYYEGMKTIAIQEVALSDNRGSKWIVRVNGQPVANFWTLAAAERKAAKLAAQ